MHSAKFFLFKPLTIINSDPRQAYRTLQMTLKKMCFTKSSSNSRSPGRRQAIIWTSAGILLIWTLGTNFSEILSEIHAFSFKKMHLKMSSAKWRPFCLGLNVLIYRIHMVSCTAQCENKWNTLPLNHHASLILKNCWWRTIIETIEHEEWMSCPYTPIVLWGPIILGHSVVVAWHASATPTPQWLACPRQCHRRCPPHLWNCDQLLIQIRIHLLTFSLTLVRPQKCDLISLL